MIRFCQLVKLLSPFTLSLVRSSSIMTRHFSTYDGSLVQLASDLDLVYNDLKEHHNVTISPNGLSDIKKLILSNSYNLSPLKMKILENGEQLSVFLKETLPEYPDLMYGTILNSKISFAMMPYNREDNLVLMALSVTLLRLLRGGLPKYGFRIENLIDDFHSNLKGMKDVCRVYKWNIQHSFRSIPITLLEDKILSLVGVSSPIFKLVSSFLRIPILDDHGNDCKGNQYPKGIPQVGEITKVIFEIYLRETLDQSFPFKFPGIAYCRFMNEIFICTNEKYVFDFKQVHDLLGEHRLLGNLNSIGPDDNPLLCHFNQLLYLGKNGKITIRDPKDES